MSARAPWELSPDRYPMTGRRILVTGAAGTVGFEIVRQLFAEYRPEMVRLFDLDESGLFFAEQRLLALGKDVRARARPIMGDVRDPDRLRRAFQNMDVVIHCAALQSDVLCDYNPFEAVQTNLLGVQNVVAAAVEAGVSRVVLTSSTRAVNPVGVVGASQLMGERLLSAAQGSSGSAATTFASVRFGTALHAGCDLLLHVREQLQNGAEVALPSVEGTRFALPLGDAARLVLAAASQAQGGEVFVAKMPALRLAEVVEVLALRLRPGHPVRLVSRPAAGAEAARPPFDELVSESELAQCVDAGDFVVVLPAARAVGEGVRRVLHAPRSDQQAPLTRAGIEALLERAGALA